jgi:hypothetical protein
MTDECLAITGRDAARTRMVTGAILAPHETQRLAIICTTGNQCTSARPESGLCVPIDPDGEMVTPLISFDLFLYLF